jgi:homoserine kinase
MKSASAFAPATIGNAGVGFDILGFALDTVGDTVNVSIIDEPTVLIKDITDTGRVLAGHTLSLDPTQNTATVCLINLREELRLEHGFAVSLRKGIALGSGMGGSAASAVGALVAANQLLHEPLSREELLRHALHGEQLASGALHADNIAPCLFGGLTLTTSLDPVRCVSVPVPDGILCVLVHPHIRIDTRNARNVLRTDVSLVDYVRQSGNLAGFIAGCYSNDLELIKHSFNDVIVEPQRSALIPGFSEVKAAARANGALGVAIAGSGPSVFAWVGSMESAEQVREAMVGAFHTCGVVNVDTWISPVSRQGARVVS